MKNPGGGGRRLLSNHGAKTSSVGARVQFDFSEPEIRFTPQKIAYKKDKDFSKTREALFAIFCV
jgi:hypothetical protein